MKSETVSCLDCLFGLYAQFFVSTNRNTGTVNVREHRRRFKTTEKVPVLGGNGGKQGAEYSLQISFSRSLFSAFDCAENDPKPVHKSQFDRQERRQKRDN